MEKYEIEEVIDEGTYGVVSKGVERETGRTVAVKEFKEDFEDPAARKGMEREIRMLNELKGPWVVELLEAFHLKGKVFFVFEYMPMNLLKVIERYETTMPLDLFRRLALRMLQGLSAIHAKGAVHRDIKPENILTDGECNVKYCDFGFTRYLPRPGDQPMTDYVATRWYRSPQLLVGQSYRQQVDVWALGCIFCEMLDGVPIFHGQNDLDELHQIQTKLGPITPEQQLLLAQNGIGEPIHFESGLKPPDYLANTYLSRIGPEGVELLKGCLTMDPSTRMTVDELLRLPFFRQRPEQVKLATKKGLRKKNCGMLYSDFKGDEVQERYIAHKLRLFGKTSTEGLSVDLRRVKAGEEKRSQSRLRVSKMVCLLTSQNLFRMQRYNPSLTILVQRSKVERSEEHLPVIHSFKPAKPLPLRKYHLRPKERRVGLSLLVHKKLL